MNKIRFSSDMERSRFEQAKRREYTAQLETGERKVEELVYEFFEWQEKDPWAQKGNGLFEIYKFLRKNIEADRPVREALYERIEPNISKGLEEARSLGSDVAYAAEYLVGNFKKDPYLVNYDEKFYFLGKFINTFTRGKKTPYLVQIAAGFEDKFSFIYRTLEKPERLSVNDKKEARKLHEVSYLSTHIAMPFYVNSMQMGYNAWEEGAALTWAIYDYIQSPRSQGQLCSLLPPDGPTFVDWNQNQWIYKFENLDWLTVGLDGVTEIPARFKG